MAHLNGWGLATALGTERQGTVLYRRRRCAAARASGGQGCDLERGHADDPLRAALRYWRHLAPHIRRVARRSAFLDGHSAWTRRDRRAACGHRRATLGRGAETPRTGELTRTRQPCPEHRD